MEVLFLGPGLGISAGEFDRALTRLYMTWQEGGAFSKGSLLVSFSDLVRQCTHCGCVLSLHRAVQTTSSYDVETFA